MPIFSRDSVWIRLTACALLSSGLSVVPTAASAQGHDAGAPSSLLGTSSSGLLLSQAETPEGGEESSDNGSETDSVERPTLSVGSAPGPLVLQVHILLEQQGYYNGSISSSFTQETAEAVKEFQTDNGLEVTGAVDAATWGPLTGEEAEPGTEDTAADESTDAETSGASPQGDSEAVPRRWIMLCIALVGLGAGGFGLWKILSVPIPKPLGPQDELDAELDDLEGLEAPSNVGKHVSQSSPSLVSKQMNGRAGALNHQKKRPHGAKQGAIARNSPGTGTSLVGQGKTGSPLTAAQVAIAAQHKAQNSSPSQDHSASVPDPAGPGGQLTTSPSQSKFVTPGSKANSLTPPPPPSDIALADQAGSLEEQNLVTTRLTRVDIVEVLVTDLQSADPTKRRKAIWELGQRSDSRAIKPLVNMMPNSDSRQRSLILAALSEIGTQTLKPMKQALAISLQDENPEVRKNAIRDLTRIYDLVAQISHLLNAALEDPDPEVQDTARWALKQLNRIRSTTAIEGSQPQQMLQQSISPPESFSEQPLSHPQPSTIPPPSNQQQPNQHPPRQTPNSQQAQQPTHPSSAPHSQPQPQPKKPLI